MATMLTIAEAAEALGVKPATVRSWIWKRQIEYIKVSRAVRIPQREIQRLIAAGTRPVLALSQAKTTTSSRNKA
jgi:excisionase family DNA binding protein